MGNNKVNSISGWGRYPVIDSVALSFNSQSLWSEFFVPVGNHRSYGDAALASFHLPMRDHNCFIEFDENNGLLTCQAGVLLSEIIDVFLSRGWFLAITPGSKLVTVGGAVASDVHGKNHHIEGCFSECIDSIELLFPNDELIICSRSANADLFYATCGGMGLTGIITKVSLFLKPVNSQWIRQSTVKTTSLEHTFEAFEKNKGQPYSVAWIDCMASGESLGRSILTVGRFADDGDLNYKPATKISVPFDFPSCFLNSFSVLAFNKIYYGTTPDVESFQKVSVDSFFYPLDSINNWNRIYGKYGFVQLQFILPIQVSFVGLKRILDFISKARLGSFLAVLKLYGPQNRNFLSFPIEGYSLALDFKMQQGLPEFISQLTDVAIKLGGRVYLAKDALLTKDQFNQSYSKANEFRELRKDFKLDKHFHSLLSRRLNL